MEVHEKAMLVVFSAMFIVGTLGIVVYPVFGNDAPIWEHNVLSSGLEVTSPVLAQGVRYRIVASDRWWYSKPDEDNLAADAQYYTTNWTDSWNWADHLLAPDGHSFLQINQQDVNWGVFSNGDTGHTYTISYTGQGNAITFRIVDWKDGNYANNDCKLLVRIYEETTVGGNVVVSDSPGTILLWAISAFVVTLIIIASVFKYCPKTASARSTS